MVISSSSVPGFPAPRDRAHIPFFPRGYMRMMPPMNRRVLLSGLCLLLSACGGGDAEIACESQYWDGTVGTCLPQGWQVVEQSVLEEKGVPEEVVAAFQSQTPVSGQYATVTVTEEPLDQPMDSTAYSAASITSVTSLPGYERIDEEEVEVGGEAVTIHIFAAQPRADQPQVRFYQLSAVGNGVGYTFTAAMPLSVEEELENEILLILRNATFADPEGERAEEEPEEEAAS